MYLIMGMLQDCYRLLCLVAPEVAQYSDGIQLLQDTTSSRKEEARAREEQLAELNLPLFQQIQAELTFSRYQIPGILESAQCKVTIPSLKQPDQGFSCLPLSTTHAKQAHLTYLFH